MEKQNKGVATELKWSVMGLWNDILGSTKRYPPKVRDYISPSDIGKNYWFRYQKMMGAEITNPFPDRVLRIFSAGNEFHNLMSNVFKALGIHINSQDELDKNGKKQWSVVEATADTLKTLGKYDNLVGGKVNIEQVREQCEKMGFSEFIAERTIKMAELLRDEFPDGLPELIYDIKSINSMAFWNKKDYLAEAYPHHRLQVFNYLKANNKPEGRLLYISKDDLMTAEFPIFLNDKKLEEAHQKDLKEMTQFIRTKTEPPKPEYIIFDARKKLRFQWKKKKIVIVGCYDYNWQVHRSQYFTLLTGCKTEEEWKEKCKKELSDKNKELKEKYKNENIPEDKKV